MLFTLLGQDDHSGQALVELAVFGAIFLMISSVLLTYGLKYNFQQQSQMTAFRRAMKIASDPNRGSGSYMISQQKYIPDPQDSMGIGSITPVLSSASVQRDPYMDLQAVDAESLDGVVTDVQMTHDATGEKWQRRIDKVAGFRIERNVTKDVLKKYTLIFGAAPVTSNDGSTWLDKTDDADDPVPYIRITDGCSGQIVFYDACYTQARMLVDDAFCTHRCEVYQQGDDCNDEGCQNCAQKCANRTNPPNQDNRLYDSSKGGAWYADNWTVNSSAYTFPVLELLFSSSSEKTMGFQSNLRTDTLRNMTIKNTETPAQLTTEQSGVWNETVSSNYILQDNMDTSTGYQLDHPHATDFVHVTVEPVERVFSASTENTMETAK